MNKHSKIILTRIICVALLTLSITIQSPNIKTIATFTKEDFSPNFVLSDESFSSKKAFPNEKSIQEYFESINSPLQNYFVEGAKASHWVYTAANGVTSSAYNVRPNLNPGMLIAYLEKEQGLMSLSNYNVETDTQKRIKYAMGFGCPDNGGCDPKYSGLVNQLNYGAYQLQYNYNLSAKNKTQDYKAGKTIKTADGQEAYLSNNATAATYRYTPHAFDSSYNLWKIMTDNSWGATGKSYEGEQRDTSYKNVILADKFKVNFDDSIETSTVNIKTITTDRQSSTVDNCNVLKQQDWTFGASSDEVEKLQRCMQKIGIFNHMYGATGYFGTITQKALSVWKAVV